MADNVTLPGTGSVVAADEVGGAVYQRVKVALGADGAAADLAPGQALSAASVPVVLASDQSDVAVTLDGEAVVLGAGVASIGKLAANSGVDIGDVDVLSSALPTGAATSALQGGGLPAALGAGGGLKVDGSGTALPVSVATAPALVASDAVIGLVGASDIVVTVTPTVDTGAYASGDLLFDSAEVANAVRANGGYAILQSVTVLDKADQGIAFTLLIADAATDFGAANSAPDPDDTEAATVLGWVPIATTDYVDLGLSKVACVRNIGLTLKAGAATTSLYIAGINGTGTPTYGAAGDLVIKLGFLRS